MRRNDANAVPDMLGLLIQARKSMAERADFWLFGNQLASVT